MIDDDWWYPDFVWGQRMSALIFLQRWESAAIIDLHSKNGAIVSRVQRQRNVERWRGIRREDARRRTPFIILNESPRTPPVGRERSVRRRSWSGCCHQPQTCDERKSSVFLFTVKSFCAKKARTFQQKMSRCKSEREGKQTATSGSANYIIHLLAPKAKQSATHALLHRPVEEGPYHHNTQHSRPSHSHSAPIRYCTPRARNFPLFIW